MMRGQHSVAVPYPHVNSWTVRNLAASLSRATEVHSRTAGKRQADSPEVSLVKDGVKSVKSGSERSLQDTIHSYDSP